MRPSGLFVKLMMLTTSSSDGEALTALRKANRILAEAKVNWAELLQAEPPQEALRHEPEPEPEDGRYTDAGEINLMFATVYQKNIVGGFVEFIEGIHRFWSERGYLTEKQYAVLKRVATR